MDHAMATNSSPVLEEAANAIRSGKNIFITGGAGSGKTSISCSILDMLDAEGFRIIRTAPTGIAADAIGGISLHRLLGLSGSLITWDKTGTATLQKPSGRRLSEVDIIFVDEISMVSRPLFDILSIEIEAEWTRGHSIRLAASGDFLQLPPVNPPAETDAYKALYKENPIHRGYAFESDHWERFLFHYIILEGSFRQPDPLFCTVLNRIRTGDISALADVAALVSPTPIPGAIWICGRKDDANARNRAALDKLDGDPVSYHAVFQGSIPESGFPAPLVLTIKPHMPIIMTVNDPAGRYSNGTMGYIISAAADRIYVALDGGKGRIAIRRHTWKPQDPREEWTFSQFPLDAAFALTVHRAQGLTLAGANISPYCWEPGQLYVMLSRVRDPGKMYIGAPLKPGYLVTDAAAVSWYAGLSGDIQGLASTFTAVPVAGTITIPNGLYRRGLRFGVYTFRFVLYGQPVSRSFIALRDRKGRWIAPTDFARYCQPAKSLRPLTSDTGDRLYFVTSFLNYAFIDTGSIDTLEELTPETVRTFLNTYASGAYGGTKRTAETISRCVATVLQFLLSILEDNGADMLLTREDIFKKKCFFSSRKFLETREVIAFPIQYDAESHTILRDMPRRAVEYLLSHVWLHDPDILMAVALQLFAGLRPSEPLSICESDLDIRRRGGQVVSVKIDLRHERPLRQDGVRTGGIKKHRMASVYPSFLQAFSDCLDRWHSVKKPFPGTGAQPLCLDSKGSAMTYITYYRRFMKAVDKIIPLLLQDNDQEIQDYARILQAEGASPHILRHVFTVTLVLSGLTEAEIMNARGDSSPLSALSYLSRKSELQKWFSGTADSIARQMMEACRLLMEDMG